MEILTHVQSTLAPLAGLAEVTLCTSLVIACIAVHQLRQSRRKS